MKLSALDKEWGLSRDVPNTESIAIANELQRYKAKEIDKQEMSIDAQDVLEIYFKESFSTYFKCMLFAEASIEEIVENFDISIRAGNAYRDLFFDTRLLKGRIGKATYALNMMSSNRLKTGKKIGQMLFSSIGAPTELINIKFHIPSQVSDGPDDLKKSLRRLVRYISDEGLRDQEISKTSKDKIHFILNVTKALNEASRKTEIANDNQSRSLETILSELSIKGMDEIETIDVIEFNPTMEEFSDETTSLQSQGV